MGCQSPKRVEWVREGEEGWSNKEKSRNISQFAEGFPGVNSNSIDWSRD